jgi:redox-sensitive bicupin YhaK (pirin superfamily)
MGYGPLRVINEDRVQADGGFGTHAHRDMEIISYALDGALAHEFNHDKGGSTPFLQIWIEPQVRRIAPEYEQKDFTAEDKPGRLRLIASPDGAEGAVRIHQDARVYAGRFDGAERARHELAAGEGADVLLFDLLAVHP